MDHVRYAIESPELTAPWRERAGERGIYRTMLRVPCFSAVNEDASSAGLGMR